MSPDEVFRQRVELELVVAPGYRTRRLVFTRCRLPLEDVCCVTCCTLMADLTAEAHTNYKI